MCVWGEGAHHIAVLCFWFLSGETFSRGVQGDAGGAKPVAAKPAIAKQAAAKAAEAKAPSPMHFFLGTLP